MPSEIETPVMAVTGASPFLFPTLALCLIGLGGVGLLFYGLEAFKTGMECEAPYSVDDDGEKSRAKLILLIVLNSAYPLALEYVGFLAITFLVLGLQLWLLGIRIVWKVGIISLAVTASLYFIFEFLLRVQLP